MSVHWESLVIAAIAFVILYFLLNKYAFGPLFGIMETRAKMVQDQISTAEKNRAESEKLLAEQKEAIQQAKKEAYDIIEQARISSTKEADNLIARAKEDSERLKQDALKDIEAEKNKAIVALRSQVSALSVLIASKIVEKQVDEKSQQDLINHYLKEVGGNKV
ncbi:F0F1 ATP synthase subunit B [Paenibacillus oceani]|uniref:ATP synthase subunit b n=1 Tax=Paenibacillus oceani TaxID=2772510 RepID=A0A927CC78_9BACL|nr:F0F1 ATP synthase subunit B [Paenibacillus oceani]MBD2863586.1 F0F1 ATP synthase subunit B [Paenibacillus oceani]